MLSTVLSFGPYELDVAARELRFDGRPVMLQPRVFETIRYLVENRDRVVDKAELIAVLWEGQQLSSVVVPWSVSHARKALGEHAGGTRYIETRRGHGYRFIAEVAVKQLQREALAPNTLNEPAPSSTEPFLGREAIMQQLRAALARAAAGEGHAYLLVGQAGIGKTRCTRELERVVRASQISVWSGRCLDGGNAPEFWPFIEILRALSADATVSKRNRGEAQRLLDSLTRQDVAVGGGMQAVQSGRRFWLLDRIGDCLLRSSLSRPRLVLVDDLHWADESSLQALGILAPRLYASKLLFVATSRDPRFGEQRSRPTSSPDELRAFETIDVSGLSVADVELYLAGTLGLPLAAELSATVHARTAGNPLFLREATRVIEALRGKQQVVRAEDVVLPDVAKDLFTRSIRGLAETTREVLNAASVLGDEFEIATLQRMCEVASERVLEALADAVAARILEPKPDGLRYGFGHPLLREVVYAELPLTQRARLHAQAGLTLESLGLVNQPVHQLAHHFHHATDGRHHERALRYGKEAGLAAMSKYAFVDAARFFGWALDALPHVGPPNSRDACELLILHGHALRLAGQSARSRAEAERVIAIADRDELPDMLIEAAKLMRLRITSIATPPDPVAVAALERALSSLPIEATTSRAQALSWLACIPPYSLSIERSRQCTDEAVKLARAAGNPRVLVEALSAHLRPLSGPDSIAALLEVADEILTIDPDCASRRRVDAQTARFRAHVALAQVVPASRALAELGRSARALRSSEMLWHHDRLVAQRLFQAGRLREAEAEFERLRLEGQRLRLDLGSAHHAVQRQALALARTGRRPTGDRSGIATWSWAREIPSWRCEHVLYALEVGERGEARRELAALAERHFEAVTRDGAYLFALAKLTLAVIALDEREHATTLKALLEPYAELVTFSEMGFSMGCVAHYLGELERYLGDARAARARYERALEIAVRVGDDLTGQRTRLALAALASDSPSSTDRARARELANEVLSAAERSERSVLAESARALLARLHQPVASRGPGRSSR